MQTLTATSNGQALHLAYHGDALLSQDTRSTVRGNVLLFGDRHNVCHRLVNVGNLLHCTLTIEAAGVQTMHAADDSARADNIIGCIQESPLSEQVTVPFLGQLIIGGTTDYLTAQFRKSLVIQDSAHGARAVDIDIETVYLFRRYDVHRILCSQQACFLLVNVGNRDGRPRLNQVSHQLFPHGAGTLHGYGATLRERTSIDLPETGSNTLKDAKGSGRRTISWSSHRFGYGHHVGRFH